MLSLYEAWGKGNTSPIFLEDIKYKSKNSCTHVKKKKAPQPLVTRLKCASLCYK